MEKRLIVNADDYGRSQGVSSGIRSAHLNGIVTSTTAMMNMPGVEIGLERAQRDCPKLGLGVHLVLTAGEPLLPASQVPTLTGDKDHFPSALQFINFLAELDPDQVRAEWNTQIQKFIRLTGNKPDHLDSHHHTSYFSQPLFLIMLELAKEYDCAIRPPLGEGGSDLPLDLPTELGDLSMGYIPALIKNFTPHLPDNFFSGFFDKSTSNEILLKMLFTLPAGTSEIMCHPGFSDPELTKGSSYNINREIELGILIEPAISICIVDQSIQLITYAQL